MAKYFKVEKKWDTLLDKWNAEKKDVVGFERYYELLFLVKSESEVGHVWFSCFEGMHHHAAIVTGLVCSKFNLSPANFNQDHSLWKISEMEMLSLSRNPTLWFLII
jgi:hypothetical protein